MPRPPVNPAQDFKYPGIDEDKFGGMTNSGKIIRDAYVFEIIEETETCKGWTLAGLEALEHKVNAEWDKYGCMVSGLPEALFERHKRIHGDAIKKARELGWNGEFEMSNDD